jgi:hypothetical protein
MMKRKKQPRNDDENDGKEGEQMRAHASSSLPSKKQKQQEQKKQRDIRHESKRSTVNVMARRNQMRAVRDSHRRTKMSAEEEETKSSAEETKSTEAHKPKEVNFDTSKDEVIEPHTHTFTNFEQSAEVAVMLDYFNSGYCTSLEYVEENNGDAIDKRNKFMEAVKNERISDNDVHNITKEILNNMGRNYCSYTNKCPYDDNKEKDDNNLDDAGMDAKLLSCAVCGVREYNRNLAGRSFKNMRLDQLDVLRCDEGETKFYQDEKRRLSNVLLPTSNDGEWKKFDVYRLYSRCEMKEGELYYLHEEFVDRAQQQATVCSMCRSKIVKKHKPRLCIANGYDFGDYVRIGFEEPTIMEQMILAKVRICQKIIKIVCSKSSTEHYTLKMHCIAFEQDAPFIAAIEMSMKDIIKRSMIFHFIDSDGKIDRLMSNTLTSDVGQVRPYVIYQYLKVFSLMNSEYKYIENRVRMLLFVFYLQ